jgi:phosphoribosylaminoimidazolecarboxamide formyltransferase/IMP cyclohydrolase
MAGRLALISVADKTGVVEFASGLLEVGFEIVSTGGTARALTQAGIPVTGVSEITGFPEMMDGRVKTLHPRLHGGILARRDVEGHRAAMAEHEIRPIDLVCVGFYPFEATVAKEGATREEVIEQIDIGGPSMVRSAAKNHADVLVVTNPGQYEEVLAALREDDVTPDLRRRLARAAFARTAAYDAAIAGHLERTEGDGPFPETIVLPLRKHAELRYGENPHQRAAFYLEPDAVWEGAAPEGSVAEATATTGRKDLSYNNLMDLDAALELVKEFEEPAAVVVKHTNPCGCALGADLREAYARAHECDPVSAFGCIVAVNREIDVATAEEIAGPNKFVEAIVAPSVTAEAMEILRTRQKWGKSLRVLQTGPLAARRPRLVARQVVGGLLLQERDLAVLNPDLPDGWEVVTDRAPTEEEATGLRFAFAVVKHVKSNAIVIAKDLAAVGVGAGQMSRVESTEIAVKRAGDRAAGSVLGSDAFFPFPDAIEVLAEAGVTAVCQPGGSIRDKDVIAAANEKGLAMVLTRMRHFKH